MSDEYSLSGDLATDEEVYDRMCKQALQNLYSAQDIMCELPECHTELNAIEQAIHALESYGRRFSDDWLSENFPSV
jgi:hypothetical protein